MSLFLTVCPPGSLTAWPLQCPDGTPLPCGPRAIDPRRIAVLPFRISAADTNYAEGIAELVAQQLAADTGFHAVHMNSVTRAWRQAGGSLRNRLTPERMTAVARAVGAGVLLDGSVVGLRDRITLAVTVTRVPAGPSHRVRPVDGPADSLGAMIGRVAANVIAILGGEGRVVERSVLSAVPAANQAYIEGLRAYRRFAIPAAAAAFERAFAEDSTFASAAFKRWICAGWAGGGGVDAQRYWQPRVIALRDRLSSSERLFVAARIGDPSRPRAPSQVLADHERVARLLPESPEAQFLLGDHLYHRGGYAGVGDHLERAFALMVRSLALDSQRTTLQHAVEIAAILRDTASLRALKSAARAANLWGVAWVAAERLGDDPWLADLRRVVPADAGVWDAVPVFGLSVVRVDEATDVALRSTPVPDSAGAHLVRFVAAVVHGRPLAARRVRVARDSLVWLERMVHAAMFADGDAGMGAEAAARLAAYRSRDSASLAAAACALGWWRVARDSVTDADGLLERHGERRCAAMLRMERARRGNAADLFERVMLADSLLIADTRPGENVALANGWLALGDARRALAAVRRRDVGAGFLAEAVTRRVEGRLALLAGDTMSAIRAWHVYLDLRRDAEPSLIPQRDSVRAELARLERR